MAESAIDVFNMDRFTDKGNLKAFADVKIGLSLRIYGCRVIQQPNQKAWASMPQRSWKNEAGDVKYAAVVELSGSLKERVEQAILAAYYQGA
jgi:DNA-binding cell septation regulator SpoVG